jgi:hypothetical protein
MEKGTQAASGPKRAVPGAELTPLRVLGVSIFAVLRKD